MIGRLIILNQFLLLEKIAFKRINIIIEDRLIYKVENDKLIIISCTKHYE